MEQGEERYQEWLSRLEIPISEQTDIDRFRQYLRDEFDITRDVQVEALWSTMGVEVTLEQHGIRAITITYPWGRELRYGVQGMPGLWGWESIQTMREGEEW